MKARHLEFDRVGKRLGVMSFESPAVSYCLLDTNQHIDRRGRNSSRFYDMLSSVFAWIRVEELPPDLPDGSQEYYHVQISILGKYCVIDAELWKDPCDDIGYLKVNFIDDCD